MTNAVWPPWLCSDKTGTLTTNEMSVVRFMTIDEAGDLATYTVEGTTYKPEGRILDARGRVAVNVGIEDFAKVRV